MKSALVFPRQEMEKHTRFLELQRLQAERFEDDKRGLLRAIGETQRMICTLALLARCF